jgi:hypothetical protein
MIYITACDKISDWKSTRTNVQLTPKRTVSKDETPKVPYPWSAFLSQPLFHPKVKLILNPAVFQQRYQVRLLESCLQKRLPSNRYPKLSG